MDFVTALMEIFNNVAVPVACLIAVFWLWNKETDSHKAESEKLTEALNNNTRVMERICAKLDIEGVSK